MNRRQLERYAPAPTLLVLAGLAIVLFPPLLLVWLIGLAVWLWIKRTESGKRFAKRFTKTC